ncbi:hypothetical protein TNCV_3395581 [Trichonephila clavipes]|nr:hypothetical protein TNCV_3395581 [Trichonephila clavipes]
MLSLSLAPIHHRTPQLKHLYHTSALTPVKEHKHIQEIAHFGKNITKVTSTSCKPNMFQARRLLQQADFHSRTIHPSTTVVTTN